jgi:dihydrofolate reductase
MKIGLIAAYDPNRVIGNDNNLPWKIKEEILLFKKITYNSIVIMGRKTYDSIGKPLVNRLNFIITSKIINNDLAYSFASVEDSLEFCEKLNLNKKIFVIGGFSIYKYFLDNNLINYMYLSEINKEYVGNIYFPDFNESFWNKSLFYSSEFFNTYFLSERSLP